MSACQTHTFRRCARLEGRFTGSAEVMRRNAITEGEPLVPYAGAAAFLIARSRSFTRPRASVKEPIETQANRHL
jgi:hypothetical protein